MARGSVPGRQEGLSRRSFLGVAAAAGAGISLIPLLDALDPSVVAAALAEAPDLRFFDPHQAAVVVEATARLIPGPGDDPAETSPGAREAGVVTFIDLFLSAFDDDPPRIYSGGPWSDRAGGATNSMAGFVPLAPWQEDLWRERLGALREVYRTGITQLDDAAGGDFSTIDPERMDAILASDTSSGFRRVLFEHTIEAMYSVPEYGGNHELTGWGDISYAGDVAPRGWEPSQVSDSDGPDPVPEDFELPFPADVASEVPGAQVEVPSGSSAPAPAHTDPLAELAAPDVFLRAALPGLGRWRTSAPDGTGRNRKGPTR